MIDHLVSRLAVLSLTTALAAQTAPVLIGCSLSVTAPAAMSSTRQDFATCATRTCNTVFVAPTPAYAGGTAFDPTSGGVYHTDGLALGLFDPTTCGLKCPPVSLAVAGITGVGTGLAYNESTNSLFMSTSANILYTWRGGCPPTVLAKCALPVPTGSVVGGLATSDLTRTIFYSSSVFSPAGPANVIYAAPQSSPCTPTCMFRPTPCPGTAGLALGPITGLAYDDCRRTLWATDGSLVVGIAVSVTATTPPTPCGFQIVSCCKIPPTEHYCGLCVMPSEPTPTGTNCTKAPCPACPTMVHDSVGDPTIGNPAFALRLVNAPAGAPAVLALNAGACTSPGIPISIFCGNLLVPLPGIITFGVGTGGTIGCTGGVTFPLPVPLNPWLCGRTLSSQFLLVCFATSGFGTGVSNCLSFTVTSS